MLTIACVRWGDKFSREYVDNLYKACRRNITIPFRFVCFTDDPNYMDGVETAELPKDVEGWWGKLYLFAAPQLTGRVLYFDLDTLIAGNIDELAKYDGDFAVLRDFTGWTKYGSAIMAWEAGKHSYIWHNWLYNGKPLMEKGDQEWIESQIQSADILQDLYPDYFVSYKEHCKAYIPQNAKVICFHGKPMIHEVDGWAEALWKGAGTPELISVLNNTQEEIENNIKSAIERDLPWVGPGKPNKDNWILVGGGPSLGPSLIDIRRRKGNIVALNNTHDYLINRGIIPDIHLLLDSRKENVVFVQNPRKDVEYWLSSQCHPDLFDALEGYNVKVWHTHVAEPFLKGIEDKPAICIGGGATVGLKGMYLGYVLGYRKMHFYGFDSSYESGKHHAYNQPLNDGQKVMTVWAGDRTFDVSPWMLKQAREFQDQARIMMQKGVTLYVHGDGLIPYVSKQWRKHAS